MFAGAKCLIALAAAFVTCTGALAQGPAESVPLNSERIEARYGSYGIEVLESGDSVRVSDLYSSSGGMRTTRTFAVVMYPQTVDDSFAAEHAAILAGASIGEVFRDSGWTIDKRNLRFGELAGTQTVRELMRLARPARLAAHIYVLSVSRAGRRFDYAWIAEVHHPGYLDRQTLVGIYGPEPELSDAERDRTAAFVALVESEMAEAR